MGLLLALWSVFDCGLDLLFMPDDADGCFCARVLFSWRWIINVFTPSLNCAG